MEDFFEMLEDIYDVRTQQELELTDNGFFTTL
jgi:hypothetical protein